MPDILSAMEMSEAQKDEVVQARMVLRDSVLAIRAERQEIAENMKQVRWMTWLPNETS